MNARADPNKINNKSAQSSHNGLTSYSSLVRQTRKHPRGSTSSASSLLVNSLDHSKVRDLYSNYESGLLTSKKFKEILSNELDIRVTDQFDRVLTDPTRNYQKLIKTFKLPERPQPTQAFYNPSQSHRVLSSTSLTTLAGVPRTQAEIDGVRALAKCYAAGTISSGEFQSSLVDKGIPISNDLQRRMKEHETTKSVSYQTLTTTILNNAVESPQKYAGKPQQVNPTHYKPLAKPNTVPTDEVSKYKSKVEQVRREYDKIGQGLYATHKKKAEPKVKDNGELCVWDPAAHPDAAKNKNQIHLEHHDIFHWQRKDITQPTVCRKFPATQRAAQNSGNIVTWQ